MLARSGPVSRGRGRLTATFLMVGAFDVLAVALAVGTLDIGGSGAGYLTAMHSAGPVCGRASPSPSAAARGSFR